jgi:hypothetical protein
MLKSMAEWFFCKVTYDHVVKHFFGLKWVARDNLKWFYYINSVGKAPYINSVGKVPKLSIDIEAA